VEVRQEISKGFVHDGTSEILSGTEPEHREVLCRIPRFDLFRSQVTKGLYRTTIETRKFKKVYFLTARKTRLWIFEVEEEGVWR
jgi:hypothetical protein